MRAWIAALMLGACGAPNAPTRQPPPEPTFSYRRDAGFAGATKVAFSVREGSSIFALPTPSEVLRQADGRIDLTGFPARDHFAVEPIFEESKDAGLDYSIKPVIYFTFDGPMDEAVVKKALELGSIRLIDVDPNSPSRGEAVPLKHRFFEGAKHVPDRTLALRPRTTLRHGNLYVAVMLRRLAPERDLLGTTTDLERIKSTKPLDDAALERARALHAEPLAYLHDEGVRREDIAAVALFRTQQAAAPVKEMIDAVAALPAPKLLSAAWREGWETTDYRVIFGYYCTPSFQTGLEHAPFIEKGGRIESQGGKAQVSAVPPSSPLYDPACGGHLRARVVVSVPKSKMPPKGWPLMVYGHGTTGDARSVLGSTHFAGMAARAGVATVSTDQPLHGSDDPHGMRPGSNSPFVYQVGPFPIPLPSKGKGGELAFYNVLRPLVLRDNLRQAVADGAALARMTLAADFSAVLSEGEAPRFDRELGYIAAGHSQGSQPATALGAMDPLARAVLLSACGGDFSSAMFLRKDAKKLRPLIELILGLADEELDEFHPFATAIQSVLDPIDPQTFGVGYRKPDDGKAPTALLVSGVGDTMTVNEAGAALSIEMGLMPLTPMPLPIVGLTPQETVKGNGPGGKTTLALLQLIPTWDYEPHYVAFRETAAQTTIESYLRGLAAGDAAPALTTAVRKIPLE